MSKIGELLIDNPLEVISGADELKENPFEVKTCFWCDRKPVKGRTSCAYHISPSGKNDEALGRLDYHVNINPLG